VEPNAIVVEVVEDGQAILVALPVVRLSSSSTSSVRPPDVVVPPTAGPPDATTPHVAPGPEVLLPLLRHQAQELPLLCPAVDRDWLHPVRPAKLCSLSLCERGAAKTPGHEVVASVELVVGTISSTASTSSVPVPSVPSVASVASATLLSPTSKKILEKSSKLWRRCSQTKPSKEEEDCEFHILHLGVALGVGVGLGVEVGLGVGVGGSQSAPVTLPY